VILDGVEHELGRIEHRHRDRASASLRELRHGAVVFIEVSTGLLRRDDIVRLEDDFDGRTSSVRIDELLAAGPPIIRILSPKSTRRAPRSRLARDIKPLAVVRLGDLRGDVNHANAPTTRHADRRDGSEPMATSFASTHSRRDARSLENYADPASKTSCARVTFRTIRWPL